MNLSEVNNRITFLSSASITDYTCEMRTIALNKWFYQMQTWILQSQDEWDFDDLNNTTYPWATATLGVGKSDCTLPSTTLKLKRVEISYNGGTNWRKADPIDIAATTESQSEVSYSTENPRYDVMGNNVVVYPAPDADKQITIKVWFDRSVNAFSYTSETSNDLLTGTKIPGIDVLFHDLLALGTAHEWRYNKLKDNSLMQDITIMKGDMQKHYSQKQVDRALGMAPAYVNYE